MFMMLNVGVIILFVGSFSDSHVFYLALLTTLSSAQVQTEQNKS